MPNDTTIATPDPQGTNPGTGPEPAWPAPSRLPPSATLAEQAFEQLERMIVMMELRPGQALTEHWACQRLGIGRTPVREALLRLRDTGLVELVPGRGLHVTAIDCDEALQAVEVGGLVERLLVERAARLATPAQRARFAAMEEAFRRQAGEEDLDGYLRTQHAMNQLIAAAAHHPFAARAARPVYSVTRRLGTMYYTRGGHRLSEVAPHHVELTAALAAGVGERALAALEALLDHWRAVAIEIETSDLAAGPAPEPQPAPAAMPRRQEED